MLKKYMLTAMTIMATLSLGGAPALAEHAAGGHGEGHAAEIVAVPVHTDWVYWLAVAFLWLFIAAIVLGPIALWLRGPEKPEVVSHAAAHGAHH